MLHFQSLWNIMLASDSYKASHHLMLPEGLEYMESYGESRGGEYPFTLVFSMNYSIKSYLTGVQVTEEKIQEAELFYKQHFGQDNIFDGNKWRYILNTYGGKLPLKIEAVKEGSVVPVKTMLYKISSTDKNCVWLVNWVETLLMKTWYGITVATNSMAGREILEMHLEKTSDNNNADFLLHDFGYRGVATEEQAWIGGAAHLLSFKGTDTVAGIRMLQKFYNAPMCGFSVPASEHMVMTIRGRENELETYREIFRKFAKGTKYENVVLSLVSDTYDIYNVCNFIHEDEEIRNIILERPGKTVLRPDSGDAKEVLEKCLEILADNFGFTINSKGYKVINPKLALLQGDGIDIYTMNEILNYLEAKQWSIDNLVFGSGGGLLQKFDRDTLKFAFKASYAVINGKEIDVFKDPITAGGSKTSKKGKLYTVYNNETGYKTINHHELENHKWDYNAMIKVFENGELLYDPTYDEILLHYKNEKLKLEKLWQ